MESYWKKNFKDFFNDSKLHVLGHELLDTEL